ncbi:hypothetical protein V8E36_003687 [Tilletia maclaganii]
MEGLRRGFLSGPARTPAAAPSNAQQKRKDPPAPGPGDGDRPPPRAAKTAASESIHRQHFPRSPIANELHAARNAELERRRRDDVKQQT